MILSEILYNLYKIKSKTIRGLILKAINKIEKKELFSKTLRRVLKEYYKVDIGMYTHGSCFVPGNFDKHTTVGRYCSIAANVKVFNRNHPMDFKSMHAFFFNPLLKYTKKDLVEYIPLTIGNDVWIGEGALIMPQVTNIGDGAVIGAGSVVSRNVPPYAILVGYPARIVRYRFAKEVINELLDSKWWEKDIEDILPNIKEYQQPYEKLYFENKSKNSHNNNDENNPDGV